MVFYESFKGVSRKFQGNLKEVSRVSQGSVKGVSRQLHKMYNNFFNKVLKSERKKVEKV